MPVVNWLHTAFNTYVLHVEHGNGYQWWSGFGGFSTLVGAWWHHVNCHEPWCWRPVKRGRTHCKKHDKS